MQRLGSRVYTIDELKQAVSENAQKIFAIKIFIDLILIKYFSITSIFKKITVQCERIQYGRKCLES